MTIGTETRDYLPHLYGALVEDVKKPPPCNG
jgi:hypothetical protein